MEQLSDMHFAGDGLLLSISSPHSKRLISGARARIRESDRFSSSSNFSISPNNLHKPMQSGGKFFSDAFRGYNKTAASVNQMNTHWLNDANRSRSLFWKADVHLLSILLPPASPRAAISVSHKIFVSDLSRSITPIIWKFINKKPEMIMAMTAMPHSFNGETEANRISISWRESMDEDKDRTR